MRASAYSQSVSGDEGRGGGGRGEDGERPFLRDRRGLSHRQREAGPSESGGGADGTHHGAASGGTKKRETPSQGFLDRTAPPWSDGRASRSAVKGSRVAETLKVRRPPPAPARTHPRGPVLDWVAVRSVRVPQGSSSLSITERDPRQGQRVGAGERACCPRMPLSRTVARVPNDEPSLASTSSVPSMVKFRARVETFRKERRKQTSRGID